MPAPRIQAIETHYNGHRFRSRLEARWAVFFDHANIKYQYEPEGYKLSDGSLYLPDFWLPDVNLRSMSAGQGIYVEVKGVYPTEYEEAKLHRFAADKIGDVALLVGTPTNTDGNPEAQFQIAQPHEDDDSDSGWWDNYMLFMRCYNCGATKYEFCESNYSHCEMCNSAADERHPTLTAAITAARSARFEHGETP